MKSCDLLDRIGKKSDVLSSQPLLHSHTHTQTQTVTE